jgi:hypothetical protein
MAGNVVVVLLYEPATAREKPVPLARIHDAELMVRAAKCAIAQAEARATELAEGGSTLPRPLDSMGVVDPHLGAAIRE